MMYQTLSQCKVVVDEVSHSIMQEEYMDSIKEQLVEVTYSWCNGHTFEEICKMTDSFEGSIIRTLRRLDELLKQMDNAAKVIGNQVLLD
jgi:ATP-dependent RNA helicase DOB1